MTMVDKSFLIIETLIIFIEHIRFERKSNYQLTENNQKRR